MYTWPTSPQLLHSHLTILCKSSESLRVQVLGAGCLILSGLSRVTLGSQFLPVLYPGSLPSWLLQQPSSSCRRDWRGKCSAGSSHSSSGIFPGYKLIQVMIFPMFLRLWHIKKPDKAVRAEQLPTFRTIKTLGGGAVACLLCHQKRWNKAKAFRKFSHNEPIFKILWDFQNFRF